MTWPTKNSAILVIHGIGEQAPFETLDVFAQSLWTALEASAGGPVKGSHRAHRHPSGWIESYLSLARPDSDIRVDVYEYYWAHQMQRQISGREVIEWLIQTSEGAREFYDQNRELAAKYQDLEMGAFDGQGRFKLAWYLGLAGPIAWILRGFLVVRDRLHIPTLGLPSLLVWGAGIAIAWARGKATRFMIDVVGDVAVYTATDVKSRHFEVRDRVLRGAAEALWDLIERYDRVIVAGHSLGSVVAYDALSRTALRMGADPESRTLATRVGGLVTFGSPLDKIAFFFRRRTPARQILRRQLQAFRFGFRARYFEADATLRDLPPERRLSASEAVPEALIRMPWLNFWNPDDPVSGHLDYYAVEPHGANVNVREPDARGRRVEKLGRVAAHDSYFAFAPMYERVIELMLNP